MAIYHHSLRGWVRMLVHHRVLTAADNTVLSMRGLLILRLLLQLNARHSRVLLPVQHLLLRTDNHGHLRESRGCHHRWSTLGVVVDRGVLGRLRWRREHAGPILYVTILMV